MIIKQRRVFGRPSDFFTFNNARNSCRSIEDDMSNKEIKILLIRHDVKQADIARKLGISKTAVHNVIKGISESRRIKKTIAQALGMKVEDLWPSDTRRAA